MGKNIASMYTRMKFNKNLLVQFIPILLLFAVLSFSKWVVTLSQTVLGKLFAVSLIVFYTTVHKSLGILTAILVILYYQSDYVENMLILEGLENKDKKKESMTDEDKDEEDKDKEDMSAEEDKDKEEMSDNKNKTKDTKKESMTKKKNNKKNEDKPVTMKSMKEKAKKQQKLAEKTMSKLTDDLKELRLDEVMDMLDKNGEGFCNLHQAYKTDKEPFLNIFKGNDESPVVTHFKKANCDKNNHLRHKGMRVRKDMVEHVYPEIKFESQPCNPCDKTCRFSIMEERLKTEYDMLRPNILRD
jgi:hypothetical protein